jgi:hypothetical protein
LIGITERLKISRQDGQMMDDGGDGNLTPIPEDAKASMNFWCFHPSLFAFIEQEFKTFLDQNINDPKAEFLIPYTADRFIKTGLGKIKVLPTDAQWFGVTYKEDAPVVTENINKLVSDKVYPSKLWT